MLGEARRRFVSLAAALLASGCSALVSLDGLTGGVSGPDGPETGPAPTELADTGPAETGEAGGEETGGGETGDASVSTLQDVAAPTDASAPKDATQQADAHVPEIDASPAKDAQAPAKDAALAPCFGDLSGVGTGDFVISLTLETTEPDSVLVAILNQRSACSPGTFWDLRLSNGKLLFELDDSVHYAQLAASGSDIDDGASHAVVVARTSGTVSITVDGAGEGSTSSDASLGALTPLATGDDVCDGNDGTVAFSQGKISNVCVGGP